VARTVPRRRNRGHPPATARGLLQALRETGKAGGEFGEDGAGLLLRDAVAGGEHLRGARVAEDGAVVLLLVPGGSWLRSVSDNPLRPTRGHRLEFNVAGSYKNPISEISFAQGSVAAVWMHPLPWSGRFIARTEQGATLVDQFDRLPTSYRFYAGGMNSIRGYAYKELGPKDSAGNVAGGKFLSVVSAEYEQSVLDDWGVAAFIDGGNAYNPDNIRIKTGAGLGVRWYSPIGLVRLDFAVPLSESDSSFQIHFAAGARL